MALVVRTSFFAAYLLVLALSVWVAVGALREYWGHPIVLRWFTTADALLAVCVPLVTLVGFLLTFLRLERIEKRIESIEKRMESIEKNAG